MSIENIGEWALKGTAPSQALPRQLSQGESQGLRLVAKVLGVMRKLPAVLLPLPLRKDFPRSGGRCRAATKGGVWHRAAMTERAHAVSLVAKVSSVMRNFPTMPEGVCTQKSTAHSRARICGAPVQIIITLRCGSHRGYSSASSSCRRTSPRCRTQPPSPARSWPWWGRRSTRRYRRGDVPR